VVEETIPLDNHSDTSCEVPGLDLVDREIITVVLVNLNKSSLNFLRVGVGVCP
jgi:hypothetical protein